MRLRRLLVITVALLLATSCAKKHSPWLETKRLPDGSLPEALLSDSERATLVAIAQNAVALTIPASVEPFIEETATQYIITYPYYYERVHPGPGYYAQVRIEKASKKVLSVLGGR